MCTIMTFNKSFWDSNKVVALETINNDSIRNGDGWSLVGIDSLDGDNNFRIQTMALSPVLSLIENFFTNSTNEGRIFLHSRFATTGSVGIGFNHAFDDRRGNIIMHNGVFTRGVRALEVDSFKLADIDLDSAVGVLDSLLDDGEMFGNIFIIDSVSLKYSVVRLSTGSLHTDGNGNYSTNPCGAIKVGVARNSSQEIFMELPPVVRAPITTNRDIIKGTTTSNWGYDDSEETFIGKPRTQPNTKTGAFDDYWMDRFEREQAEERFLSRSEAYLEGFSEEDMEEYEEMLAEAGLDSDAELSEELSEELEAMREELGYKNLVKRA